MAFAYPEKVVFRHCDPAGIVFYPRYFEMMNDTVEAFFGTALDAPFDTMHPDNGVPMAQINVKFVKPSRHGETIDLTVIGRRVGRSSFDATIVASHGNETRFTADVTMVYINSEIRAVSWPAELRAGLLSHVEEASA